jgi:hypothetical protein
VGCWNIGKLEYWVLNPSIHRFILPLFQALLRQSEAIDGSTSCTMNGANIVDLVFDPLAVSFVEGSYKVLPQSNEAYESFSAAC